MARWNVLDWMNFLIFFQAFVMWGRTILLHEEQVEMELDEANGPPFDCNSMGSGTWSEEEGITDILNDNSEVCRHFGYFDPYKKMYTAREARPLLHPRPTPRGPCPAAAAHHPRSPLPFYDRLASTWRCASTSSCSRSSSSPT